MEQYTLTNGEKINVNYGSGKLQERMERNGWRMMLRENYRESPSELYERLKANGYKQVKVYWDSTMIRGLHTYFAFVK